MRSIREKAGLQHKSLEELFQELDNDDDLVRRSCLLWSFWVAGCTLKGAWCCSAAGAFHFAPTHPGGPTHPGEWATTCRALLCLQLAGCIQHYKHLAVCGSGH